uniref:Uncharacterized protein n=1 Tax=Caenorhabditis japonica TaxID=281687 RepID=A0A8R1IAT6_CAEJA
MSDGPSVRTRGGQNKEREDMKKKQKELEKTRKNRKRDGEDPFQTPQKRVEFNALDERRKFRSYDFEIWKVPRIPRRWNKWSNEDL